MKTKQQTRKNKSVGVNIKPLDKTGQTGSYEIINNKYSHKMSDFMQDVFIRVAYIFIGFILGLLVGGLFYLK
jgi:hypothetical protein